MNKILLTLILLIISISSFAQDLVIPKEKFYIDKNIKIILSNYNISGQENISSTKLELDDTPFILNTLESPLAIGKEYVGHFENDETTNYSLYFTTLPIISIDTNSAEITNDKETPSTFIVNAYDSIPRVHTAGLEIRGGTSQFFPKKQYSVDFYKNFDTNETEDISVLGMRTDSEYNMWAFYNEPLRFRNMTSWQLWSKIGKLYYQNQEQDASISIKMKYTEVFLNGDYKGIYAIGEKIDRKQLKLKKYGGEIKGELYKADNYDMTWFNEVFNDYDNNSRTWKGWSYKYPKVTEATDWKKLYTAINFVVNSSSSEFASKFESFFNLDNLIDYFLFINTAKAADNFGKNYFVAKYKKNDPYIFVPWDLDQVFGRKWSDDALLVRDPDTSTLLYNTLFDKMFAMPGCNEKIKSRYKELRDNDIISVTSILSMFHNNYNFLKQNGVYDRERKLYTQVIASNNENELEELSFIEIWTKGRIAYLDNTFDYHEPVLSGKENDTPRLTIYPIPVKNTLTFSEEAKDITILKISGEIVKKFPNYTTKIDLSEIAKGVYIITAHLKTGKTISKKIIVN